MAFVLLMNWGEGWGWVGDKWRWGFRGAGEWCGEAGWVGFGAGEATRFGSNVMCAIGMTRSLSEYPGVIGYLRPSRCRSGRVVVGESYLRVMRGVVEML